MKKAARMAAIALAATFFASASAKPHLGCSTLVIQYVGEIDRPVFPIIVSSSAEEAERYKRKLFSDPTSTFAHVYIVQESTMKTIADIRFSNGDMRLPSPDDAPRKEPMLRLVLANRHNDREIDVEAVESVSLLGEIEKRVHEYPPIVEQLSDLQNRMNRYLNSPQ